MTTPKEKPISVRLDPQLMELLTRVCQRTERPKTWHVEQALRSYLDREIEFLEAVEEGIRADESGELEDHTHVVAMFDQAIAGAQRKSA